MEDNKLTKQYYSLAELAKNLNVPASTLRYWKEHFLSWIPHQGEGRKMRYHAESIDIFRFIQQSFSKNISADDIKDMLAEKYPLQHDMTTPYPEASPAKLPAVLDNMNALQSMIETIMDKAIGKLTDAIANVQELKDENRELKQRLAKLESIVLKTQAQQLNNNNTTKKKQVKISLDKRIQKMRDDKVSWDKIADALNNEGVKNPNTGGKWNRKAVQKVVQ